MAFSGCELDRENDDEGRHHGGKQTGTISMIRRESETWTSLHRQDRWNQFFPVASIVKIGRYERQLVNVRSVVSTGRRNTLS